MYCIKCGKYFDGEGNTCPDCKPREEQIAPIATPTKVDNGFGRALTATILGGAALFFVLLEVLLWNL